ncbi:hypothetical protein ACJA29_03345 [Metamycoplasma sualvi]|uniref:hypothetical protein n=1 Tax=Metamycoplasma sualvi TaxID=2125 RepID=UPI003873364C
MLQLSLQKRKSLTINAFYDNIWKNNNGLAKFYLIKKSEIDNVRNGNSSSASIVPIDISSNVFNKIKTPYSDSTNTNYYPLTSPIVIPEDINNSTSTKFTILTFTINESDKKIYYHNASYAIESNNCTFQDSGKVGLNKNNNNSLNVYLEQNNNNNSKVSTFWTNNWSNDFNKAFLLPTRNMFNERVITFAYPYASPSNSTSSSISLPIFNVFQMEINNSDAAQLTFNNSTTKSFNFGEKIVNHYINNRLATMNLIASTSVLKWYPWPNAIDSIIHGANDYANYTEQLYSRLISVSPFDNTIIYASRPNKIENVNNKDAYSGYSGVSDNYASFWIGNSLTGQVSNFIIPNSSSAPYSVTISNELIANTSTSGNAKSGGIYDLYKNGFWFDVNSLTGQNNKLNLYFPTTGTKKDVAVAGADSTVKSTPIAFINPLIINSINMDSLTTNSSNGVNKTRITDNSFTNYITSRADLNQWFPRTYQNLTKGANYYQNNEALNDYNDTSQNRAVATSFGKLSDPAFFGANNKSVELFSNWQVGSYNSMAVKRVQIVTKIDNTSQATPSLNVTLKFNLTNNSWTNPFYTDTNGIAKIKTFEYPVTISNASWQLLDSWSTNYKVESFNQTPNQNNITIQVKSPSGAGVPNQGKYGSSFGTHNIGYWNGTSNNLTFSPLNNANLTSGTDSPLRLELGINYNPNNDADSTWKNALENEGGGKFKKTYPLNSSNGETTFNTILNDFIKWKVANLTYGDAANPTNGIYSPGQIIIQAHLKLNPNYTRFNSTIYTLADGTQIGCDATSGVSYIYKDEYKGNRNIYEQTSKNFDDNSEYGFGSQVKNNITNSWISVPTNTSNFVAHLLNGTTINIKDTLVRDGQTATTDKIFSAKYNDDGTAIILTPENNYLEWAKQRFSSYNQMIGRYAKFQYLLVGSADETSNWKDFNSNTLKDSDGKNMFASGSYKIPNSSGASLPNNIQKVRFALYSLPTNHQDWNADKIVSSSNLSGHREFVSDAISLDSIPIRVDYNWLKDISLTLTGITGKYLNGTTTNNIVESEFTNALNTYQTNVLNKAQQTLGALKDKLKLTYSLDQSSYVDANALYNLLKTKWQNYNDSNLGIISLYNNDNQYQNNNNVATKIYVKFAVKNDSDQDKYKISEANFTNGNNIIEKTDIKYFINLKPYIDVLTSSKTAVVQGSTPNSITSFTPPAMTGNVGNGFLYGKSYDDITTVLAKFGIAIEYQKNNSWTTNKAEINSYDPNAREIKMRFKVDTTNLYNVVLSTDGTNIVNGTSDEISLKLNVPILVTLQDNVKKNFLTKSILTGNNWNLNINISNAQTIINDIQHDGKNAAAPADKATWDELGNYLEVQYALQNNQPDASTTFYTRQNFINHLKAQNETNYSNTVWVRLYLKTVTGEDPKFILSNGSDVAFQLNNTSISTINNIKIYVQAAKYESALDQIGAIGSTGHLQLTYPELIQQVVNASSNSSNNLGIKIQYSLKPNIGYNANSGNDINNSWVDQAPTSVPTGTPSLKIRIITTNNTNYEYGMGNSAGTPSVHSIDLTQLSQLVDINSDWFNEVEIVNSNNQLLYLKHLTKDILTSWEDKIWAKSKAIQTDSLIKDLVQITYTIGDDQTIYTADTLVTQLQKMIKDYNNSETLGIIKLWGEDQRGIKINATFSKKNDNAKVIFVDDINSTTASTKITSWANTFKIQTEIDLSAYVNHVKSQKIAIVLGNSGPGSIQSFTMPSMTGTKGSGFLAGYTYDEIARRLQELGINFKYHELNVPAQSETWKLKDQVNAYDQTNPKLCLGVSFTNSYLTDATTKGNIIVKFTNNKLMGNAKYIQGGTLQNPPAVQLSILEKDLCPLSLLAPTLVTVDISQLTSQLPLEGDTKNISNASTIETKIPAIISEVKKPLQDNGIDISDLNLEIRFSLNNLVLEETISDPTKSEDGIWFTFDKFKDILSNSTTNYNTNNVYAKFYIKDNPKIDDIDKYLLSNADSANINPSNLTASAKLKIYINNTTETQEGWIFANLKLTGSQENFTITNLSDWLNSQVPGGLEVEYNVVAENNQPKADSWQTVYSDASPIDSLRNYWIRFKVKEAYVFQGALANDPQHSQAFKLDGSQIQVALKVSSSWLENITLTGNLKDLTINEQPALDEIIKANMMPVTSIIQIEYTYDGINWYIKDTFTSHLQNAAGAKDDTNWIILREDIKARFVLNANVNNTQNPRYLLEVDNTNINEDNSNNISKQLISPTLNNSVKGYINLNKLVPYQAANFSVIGSDTEAFLNIKDYNNLNASLAPYSSNNLFSILYKNDKTASYSDANKVWTPGTPLEKSMLLKWFIYQSLLCNAI